ncbi:MAG: hypothetical protein MZV70_08965 [Desulfobacterales bacterium]|nr:hypothetical protein [Desulfobacterales bacterium]
MASSLACSSFRLFPRGLLFGAADSIGPLPVVRWQPLPLDAVRPESGFVLLVGNDLDLARFGHD